ncbi:MAG: hypothetical protein Q8936_05050 [Bacillota bacterium]|nr:hypothetical protein [Bacillota bacterium]
MGERQKVNKCEISCYNSIFERIADSINLSLKQELLDGYKLKFNNLDEDIILTVQEFIMYPIIWINYKFHPIFLFIDKIDFYVTCAI